jgi:hypothetical protein
MFSIIVELADTIDTQYETIEKTTHQKTLLPAPAIEGKNHQPLRKRTNYGTNASREPIEGNLVRMISIPKGCCLRQTMPRFPCVAIHGPDYGFSMDQVERANFEHLALACHLPDNLSTSSQQ